MTCLRFKNLFRFTFLPSVFVAGPWLLRLRHTFIDACIYRFQLSFPRLGNASSKKYLQLSFWITKMHTWGTHRYVVFQSFPDIWCPLPKKASPIASPISATISTMAIALLLLLLFIIIFFLFIIFIFIFFYFNLITFYFFFSFHLSLHFPILASSLYHYYLRFISTLWWQNFLRHSFCSLLPSPPVVVAVCYLAIHLFFPQNFPQMPFFLLTISLHKKRITNLK